MRVLPVLALSLFLLIGALGLRGPTVEDCESDETLIKDSDVISCYYDVAMTVAYLTKDPQQARAVCTSIWTNYGVPAYQADQKHIVTQIINKINSCYYEVAKITRDEETCAYICGGGSDAGRVCQENEAKTELFGSSVSRDLCESNVERLKRMNPDDYFSGENICIMVFVLPILTLASLRIRPCP